MNSNVNSGIFYAFWVQGKVESTQVDVVDHVDVFDNRIINQWIMT